MWIVILKWCVWIFNRNLTKRFFPLIFIDNVPEELEEPFYTDQYDQEHIKPPVVNLLLSAELYCRAGSLILKSDAAKPLLGHDAVIQALAQKGLYVTDQEKLVTERDLHKKPIQMVSLCIYVRLFLVWNAYICELYYKVEGNTFEHFYCLHT